MWHNVLMNPEAKVNESVLVPVCPCQENICAVLVTYFPDAGLATRLDLTKRQVAEIVIVDNASDMETFSNIEKATLDSDVQLIRNQTNLGIAAALNQGMQWARAKGYPWVLLLDQDTVPAHNMVCIMSSVFQDFQEKHRLALIGSNRFLNSIGKKKAPSDFWKIAETVITSGSLLSLNAVQQIGPFRDEFFIDCVDFDFCLRARTKGFEIVETLAPVMEHFIGNPMTVRLLWLRIQVYNHRPWRSYYMVRNFVVLAREYLFKDPWWVLRMAWAISKIVFLKLLLEECKILKLRYVILGLYDGLLGRFTRKVI